MMIMSAQFQHKQIHKGTWISPDQSTVSQTGHVLINSNKKKIIEDVRSMRASNIYSDHFLLKVIIKQKLHSKKKKKKWNKANLQSLDNTEHLYITSWNNFKRWMMMKKNGKD
jgi:hypothetical protein